MTTKGDEVWWDASVVDDDIARQILDGFYRLPEALGEGLEAVRQRFGDHGLRFVTGDGGA